MSGKSVDDKCVISFGTPCQGEGELNLFKRECPGIVVGGGFVKIK